MFVEKTYWPKDQHPLNIQMIKATFDAEIKTSINRAEIYNRRCELRILGCWLKKKDMKPLILLVTFFFYTVSFAQKQKKIDYGLYPNKDTVLKFSRIESRLHQLKLDDLRYSTDYQKFRVWYNDIYIIEIYKKTPDSNPEMVVMPTIYKYYTGRFKRKGKEIGRKVHIETAVAEIIYNEFINLKVSTLPSYNEIQGYELWDDGITQEFEYADNKNYRTFSYCSLSAQSDSIREVKAVNEVFSLLNKYVNLDSINSAFHKNLKSGNYSYSQGIIHSTFTK